MWLKTSSRRTPTLVSSFRPQPYLAVWPGQQLRCLRGSILGTPSWRLGDLNPCFLLLVNGKLAYPPNHESNQREAGRESFSIRFSPRFFPNARRVVARFQGSDPRLGPKPRAVWNRKDTPQTWRVFTFEKIGLPQDLHAVRG